MSECVLEITYYDASKISRLKIRHSWSKLVLVSALLQQCPIFTKKSKLDLDRERRATQSYTLKLRPSTASSSNTTNRNRS